MLATLLAAAWIAMGQSASTQGAPASPASASALELEVALVRTSDRGGYSRAGNSDVAEFDGHVWITPACGMGAGGNEPREAPAIAWHYRARVLAVGRFAGHVGQSYDVEIVWRRVWVNGARLADDRYTTQRLTLGAGESIELDGLTPAEAAACGRVQLLAAMVTSSRDRYRSMAGASGVGGRGGGRGGAGGGGTTGGASAGPIGSGGVGLGGGGGGGFVVTGAGGKSVLPLQPGVPVSGRRFDAEVWLVHRLPDGTEEVQRQDVKVWAGITIYGFPAAPVAPSAEGATVEMRGSLQLAPLSADGTVNLRVFIERRISRSGERPMLTGGSFKTIAMPGPADVVSFELPPFNDATRDSLAGHDFSIRLRVK